MNEQEKQNTAQDNESNLADLEPNGEVKGGGSDLVKIGKGEVVLSTAATQGRSVFIISTDRVGP